MIQTNLFFMTIACFPNAKIMFFRNKDSKPADFFQKTMKLHLMIITTYVSQI